MTPTIGVVTALPDEGAAFRALVPDLERVPHAEDDSHYHAGWLPSLDPGRPHRVVTTLMPRDGTNNASAVCTHLVRSFPTVRCVVMCGIAGGVPAPDVPERHVRLGDVVVATEGIVDYGHIRRVDGATELRRPVEGMSMALLRSARELQVGHRLGHRPWERWLASPPDGFARPGPALDVLMVDGVVVRHPDRRRSGHPDGMPRVHYAAVGSADQLVRDAAFRDDLARRYKIRAVEMEASGIAAGATLQGTHWFVVRGVVDYCDNATKNDAWHRYSALAAAAYLRALLAQCPSLGPGRAARSDAGPNGRVAVDGLGAILDVLLALPLFRDDLQRQEFLAQLPDDVRSSVRYHPDGRLHTIAAIRACQRFAHGRQAFLEALRVSLPGTSEDLAQAETVIAQHWPTPFRG